MVTKMVARMQRRAMSEQRRSDGTGDCDASAELIIVQYIINMLDTLLEDVSVDDVQDARVQIGLPPKKLLN